MARQGKKRLSVDLPIATFEILKECATYKGQTITVYVIRAILEKIGQDNGKKGLIKAIK